MRPGFLMSLYSSVLSEGINMLGVVALYILIVDSTTFS